jgi:GWxTD domain-containing protein
VALMIEAPEREAFPRLGTKEEKEHFIGQFWLWRDPTPGTERNERKEEHYGRIGYANAGFGGTGRWRANFSFDIR